MFLLFLGGLLIIAFIYGLITGDMSHWLFKAGIVFIVILLIGTWFAIGLASMFTA
jgi:hypothetical protein